MACYAHAIESSELFNNNNLILAMASFLVGNIYMYVYIYISQLFELYKIYVPNCCFRE